MSEELKEIYNQKEYQEQSKTIQRLFNTEDENQKLKELGKQIEQLTIKSDEQDSPGKLSNFDEQRKNFSQKQTPIIYNINEEESLKEMNKINLPIQSREKGKAKTNFPQKEIKQTPSYNIQKSSGSNPSPLYSYYDEYSKYLSKYIHLDDEKNKKNTFQFTSNQNLNQNKNSMITGFNQITSPKGDSTNQTPNYNDFNFFSNNNTNNKSPEPVEFNFNNNNNINIINNNNNNVVNESNTNQFKKINNININYGQNLFNNNNFNFQNLNEIKISSLKNELKQNDNQFNQFTNFPQINFNSFPLNYQNQIYFQNNMMFNKEIQNSIIQQQTPINKLNPEDYIFEKFGKRGWQCEKCNNFNFESKIN